MTNFTDVAENYLKPISEALSDSGADLQVIAALKDSSNPELATVKITEIVVVIITKTVEILNTNGIFENYQFADMLIQRLTKNNQFQNIIVDIVSVIISISNKNFNLGFAVILVSLILNIVALVADIMFIVDTASNMDVKEIEFALKIKKDIKRDLKTALKIKN